MAIEIGSAGKVFRRSHSEVGPAQHPWQAEPTMPGAPPMSVQIVRLR